MAAFNNNYSMAYEDSGYDSGISDADINAYVQANIGNPAAIAAAAAQYGVSLEDLSRATGYDTGTINDYFSNAGVSPVAPVAPVQPEIDYAAQQREDNYSYTPPSYTVDETGNFNYSQPEPVTYTPPTPPPAPTPAPVVTPPPAPVYTPPPQPEPTYGPPSNYVNNTAGRVFEDVSDFGTYDYYSQPQTRTEPTPPPAPTPPPVVQAPPQPVYTAPAAPAAPTYSAPAQDVAGKLTDQILAQGTTSKWTGEGFGSAQANAADMAKILSGIGITDISQFGKITVPADVAVTPKYEYIQQYVGGEDGYITVPRIVGYTDASGNAIDPSIVKTEQIYSGGDSGADIAVSYVAPIGTQEAFGNKVTGQAVPNTYGERQTGDAFGGTYTGKDNTGYRVQFDEKGNPYFYTTGQSSSDVGSWMPIVQLALAATGAGGLLGNALLGSGAGAIATNALGNAILSGATTGLAGGDVLKGALLGGVGGAIGGYLQGSGTPSAGGTVDGANVNFNDLAETNLIDSLKERGLTNQQIGQWMDNASATDLGWTAPDVTSPVTPVTPAPDVLGDFINQQGLNTVIPDLGTVEVVGSAPTVTTPVVPTMVDPRILDAVTANLNNSLVSNNTPTVEVVGDKIVKPTQQVDTKILDAVTAQLNNSLISNNTPTIEVVGDRVKTTDTKDTNVPTVEVVGDRVTGPAVPTVEIVGDKVVKTDDNVPTIEIVDTKPVKPDVPTVEVVDTRPTTPEIPTIEIVDTKPVKPVEPDVPTIEIVDTKPEVPEVIITEPPVTPEPPVVPPVIIPPVVLPPPPPPPPPVVVPPVTVTPTVTGQGLNPGMIEPTPFYNTTNDAQARYFWGGHGFQAGPTFNAAAYNAVAAPESPWGAQGVAAPLSAKDYEDIIMGRPFRPQEFTPATRSQAYDPRLLQAPVNQLAGSTTPVTGPAVPETGYTMTANEYNTVVGRFGPALAEELRIAMANNDIATVQRIREFMNTPITDASP